jgi:hypothetical protein
MDERSGIFEILRTNSFGRPIGERSHSGVFPFPEGYDDDLTGPDYVPMPTDDDAEREQDLAEALRKARVAHMRKIGAKSS